MDEIQTAARALAPYIVHTPLLHLSGPGIRSNTYLKLENLQPIGAFKVRCMGYALLSLNKNVMRQGVYTASSGNAGLGLAWMADILDIQATVYSPKSAPSAKLDAIRSLNAKVVVVNDNKWWQIIQQSGHPHDPGIYIDAVRSPQALAGNATIGLEILDELPRVDRIIVPFGGGGLVSGIASAIRARQSNAQILVAESNTAAPLKAAFEANAPVTIETTPSFISGAGAPSVLEEMWPLVKELVDEVLLTPVEEVANAVRYLAEHNHIVAEGAGAIAVATVLKEANTCTTVCVISGGNIANDVISDILQRSQTV